jgi:prepilin-type N-terminal cleavage/methylation domain-containing protein
MQEGRRAKRLSRGFSLIELLIVIAIILILVSIAVPMYDKIQMNARETAAIRDLDAINKAQLNYHNGPASRYATNLAELCGNSTGSGATPKGAEISGTICTGEAHGYMFTVASTSPAEAYTIDARPKTPGSSGRRFFYSDQNMIVRQSDKENEPATANSPQVK